MSLPLDNARGHAVGASTIVDIVQNLDKPETTLGFSVDTLPRKHSQLGQIGQTGRDPKPSERMILFYHATASKPRRRRFPLLPDFCAVGLYYRLERVEQGFVGVPA